jgi:hypothetical protein
MRRILGVIAGTALAASACGGHSGSPTFPSNVSSSSLATIGGTVQGTTSAMSAASAGLTGVTVTLVGTAIKSGVDAGGRFMLANVPPGGVQLRISGTGTDATVTLSPVQASQIVDVVLVVAGNAATVDSEIRSGAGEAELEGRVESLPPTMPALTFKASGKSVKTTTATRFTQGGATRLFTDLQIGMRVHARGTLSGDTLTASLVDIQNTNNGTGDNGGGQDSSASIHGTLAKIGGTKPNLVLTVDTTTVRTSSGTEVKRRGDVQNLDTLRVGQSLHVVGTRLTDGSLDARLIEIDDDSNGGEFEIEGSLGGLHGTCPSIGFKVNGYTIATSTSTVFESACPSLKSGDKVNVKGTKQGDGSVAATRVKKD